METVTIDKGSLSRVLEDVEKLLGDVEDMMDSQEAIAEQRLTEIKSGAVEGGSEKELDNYLKQRGIKSD